MSSWRGRIKSLRQGRWADPRLAWTTLRARRALTLPSLAPTPTRVIGRVGAATPVEVSQALQHWAGQGVVDAMLVATPALSQAVEIPLGMAVVWVNEIEGLDPRGVDQALSDHVPDGGWVFPFDARDRWFAPEMTVAQFVTATDAARAPAQIYSVRPGPTGWALDKVRTARLRPAYAKQSGTIVGPDFGWVRTPVDSRHLGLRVLRLEPPSTQPSHSVVVDWPNWPSWDPQQQVGADVVAASTTPGAASHQRSDARTVMMAPDWMGFGNLLYCSCMPTATAPRCGRHLRCRAG